MDHPEIKLIVFGERGQVGGYEITVTIPSLLQMCAIEKEILQNILAKLEYF